MALTRKGLGWKPDRPDPRDVKLMLPPMLMVQRPSHVDLRDHCNIPVYDQGELGSCTANGIAAAYQFDMVFQKCPVDFMPSRLFIYWNERYMEGTVNEDAGAEIRDGIKSIGQFGVCPETEWPYNIDQFIAKPFQLCYDNALLHRAISYRRVTPNLNMLRSALAGGLPVVFGTELYESFESEETARTGIVTMPEPGEAELGGHCMALWGYDDPTQTFLVRNSWGPDWGQGGYCLMPYPYIVSDMTSDFWSLRRVMG